MPKPDVITKLFFVDYILSEESNSDDEVMFLISLIEDETKNHEEKEKTLHDYINSTFEKHYYLPMKEES